MFESFNEVDVNNCLVTSRIRQSRCGDASFVRVFLYTDLDKDSVRILVRIRTVDTAILAVINVEVYRI